MAVAVGDDVFAAHINLLLNKPIVRLIQQAAQSLASGTNAALTFAAGSEDIDTHNFHDTVTNNTRITPTIAGYYRATGTVELSSNNTTQVLTAIIFKNGASVQPFNRTKPALFAQTCSVQVVATVQMDGLTDYVELFGGQTDSGAAAKNTQASGGINSVFELEYLRPL